MKHLLPFIALLALLLAFGCKTAQPKEDPNNPGWLKALSEMDAQKHASADTTKPKPQQPKPATDSAQAKKPGIIQRVFKKTGKKQAANTSLKKCKKCYIVNTQASDNATITAPISQGDHTFKNDDGNIVAPEENNLAQDGQIDTEDNLDTTSENKKPPALLILLGLAALLILCVLIYIIKKVTW